MNALASLSPLVVVGLLAAQQPVITPPQTGAPAQGPATESAEPTPEERVQKLRDELDKLKAELAFIKQLEASGGLAPRVTQLLDDRSIEARSIASKDAPAPQPEQAAAPARPTGARLMTDAEKGQFGDDVVMVIDGLPVTQADFDGVVSYLQGLGEDGGAATKQRAVAELVKQKAAEAAFPDGAKQARVRLLEVQRALQEGGDFAALAKERSDCPSKHQGGDLGMFDRNTMDFSFTRAAFGQGVGEVSAIVPTMFGYHLIKTTAAEKGDEPAKDRVRASHILAMYTSDQLARSRVGQRAQSGKVDLAFRSEELKQFTPAGF